MIAMTDLEMVKRRLQGHTICLVKDGRTVTSDKRGIMPMMGFIAENADLEGYSVADLVVGKAAAMLFVKCKIKAAFAKTISQSGKETLEKHGIPVEYETLTDKIINRTGDDVCPMEKAVSFTDDVEEGYLLLKKRLENVRKANEEKNN